MNHPIKIGKLSVNQLIKVALFLHKFPAARIRRIGIVFHCRKYHLVGMVGESDVSCRTYSILTGGRELEAVVHTLNEMLSLEDSRALTSPEHLLLPQEEFTEEDA